MRVWALASCSTLLALAACTANQQVSQELPKDSPTPEGEDSVVQAGLQSQRVSQGIARPETSRGSTRTQQQPSTEARALLQQRLNQIRASRAGTLPQLQPGPSFSRPAPQTSLPQVAGRPNGAAPLRVQPLAQQALQNQGVATTAAATPATANPVAAARPLTAPATPTHGATLSPSRELSRNTPLQAADLTPGAGIAAVGTPASEPLSQPLATTATPAVASNLPSSLPLVASATATARPAHPSAHQSDVLVLRPEGITLQRVQTAAASAADSGVIPAQPSGHHLTSLTLAAASLATPTEGAATPREATDQPSEVSSLPTPQTEGANGSAAGTATATIHHLSQGRAALLAPPSFAPAIHGAATPEFSTSALPQSGLPVAAIATIATAAAPASPQPGSLEPAFRPPLQLDPQGQQNVLPNSLPLNPDGSLSATQVALLQANACVDTPSGTRGAKADGTQPAALGQASESPQALSVDQVLQLKSLTKAETCAGDTRVLAHRIPDAATAGTPIPDRVESPTRYSPEMGVEQPGNTP